MKDEFDEELNDAIDKTLDETFESIKWTEKEIKCISKNEYDGFQGMPPTWLPDPLKQEFDAVRTSLLRFVGPPKKEGENSVAICKGYIQARRKFLSNIKAEAEHLSTLEEEYESIYSRPDYWPAGLTEKLDALNYIWEISQLGEDKGFKAYMGKGPEKIYRGMVADFLEHKKQKKAGEGKRGYRSPLKSAIDRLSPSNFDDIIKIFADENIIPDLYESEDEGKRIDIYIQEVDQEKEEVLYIQRSSGQKKVTFKRLRNILSELKNT
jgi:hypothetical protein